MARDYVIGIDSGTSVVKAALFDMQGTEVLVNARNTPVIEEHFGWSEFDMDTDWNETALCLKELMARAAEKGIYSEDIAALGVGGKGQGVCLLDRDMCPIRNAVMWNDTRCVDVKNEWMRPGGVMEQIHSISGNWLYTGNMALVMPWMKAHEKENLDRAVTISMPTSWLTYQLTGVHKLVRNDVFTLIDGKTREYSEEIFKIIGMEDYRHLFPDPIDAWEITGQITADAAELTGLPAGIPVVNMGWDTICCTAGVGAIGDGQANIILGTSGVIQLVMPFAPTTPERLGAVCVHAIPGKWCQLISPMTGTPNSDWFVKNFTHADHERAKQEGRSVYALFDEEIANVPLGSNGVIYHPYLSPTGEMAPFTNTAARAQFIGLLPHDTRYVMLRAIYEGVALAFRHCLDAYSFPISEIRLSGGGSKSAVWCQIFADVCNAPISLASGTEFGVKGVAWNAAWAAGAFETQQEACDAFCAVDRVYTPNPAAVEQYADLYEVYKAIPPAMFDIWDKRMAFLKKYGYEG